MTREPPKQFSFFPRDEWRHQAARHSVSTHPIPWENKRHALFRSLYEVRHCFGRHCAGAWRRQTVVVAAAPGRHAWALSSLPQRVGAARHDCPRVEYMCLLACVCAEPQLCMIPTNRIVLCVCLRAAAAAESSKRRRQKNAHVAQW